MITLKTPALSIVCSECLAQPGQACSAYVYAAGVEPLVIPIHQARFTEARQVTRSKNLDARNSGGHR